MATKPGGTPWSNAKALLCIWVTQERRSSPLASYKIRHCVWGYHSLVSKQNTSSVAQLQPLQSLPHCYGEPLHRLELLQGWQHCIGSSVHGTEQYWLGTSVASFCAQMINLSHVWISQERITTLILLYDQAIPKEIISVNKWKERLLQYNPTC